MIMQKTGLVPERRRNEIVRLAKEKGIISTADLVKKFKVSKSTLSRDLKILEENKEIIKTFGGVKFNDAEAYSFDSSTGEQINEKRAIAKLAFSLITEGSSILLMPGVTTFELAKLIVTSGLNIWVITNSLKAISHFVEHGFYNVTALGGEFFPRGRSFKGKLAIESMKLLDAKEAFIGVHGIDPEIGITLPFFEETELVGVAMERCKRKIILADSSKFGRVSLYRVNKRIEEIDVVVTDGGTPRHYVEALKSKGVEVLIAEVGEF